MATISPYQRNRESHFSVELIPGIEQKESTQVKRQNLNPVKQKSSNSVKRKSCRQIRKRRRTIAFLLILISSISFALFCGFMIGKVSARWGVLFDKDMIFQNDMITKEMTTTPVVVLDEYHFQVGSSSEWNLLLVNYKNPLPKDFIVPELTQLRDGHAIDSRAYPSLQLMMDDARAAGLDPLICSSFRTWEKQEELYQNKVQSLLEQGLSLEEAETQAKEWVAYPGTSEHQAGLAVDIVDTNYQRLDQKQENTKVQKWLMEHCAEYGFILRYPTDKSEITGIGYEPWHYRYVGKEVAQVITKQGICLEEYLLQ